jgi:hypothetical protein
MGLARGRIPKIALGTDLEHKSFHFNILKNSGQFWLLPIVAGY